ncbi:MAG: hypothetical protein HGA22_01385, partial [Clostridiales bacterium]|nr:hypothetical protein [Clostridiales bacterium]
WSDASVPLNPFYSDSKVGTSNISIPYDKIGYMPPIVNNSFLLIGGLSLDEPEKPMTAGAWLGAGEEIYVSQNNLYVSINEGYSGIRPMRFMAAQFMPPAQQEATLVYKFALKDGTVTYQARGQVPGTILNQFSMDESGSGYFRIATTEGQSFWMGDGTSSNNVYILDSGLNITGRLEDLAKGEKIYSVRFMGDRGYVVTFRTVDPLFVIDLKDQQKPSVLGSLKIPGYSDYLHPYDENHIIGFGKDTITVSQKDSSGNVTDTTAFYLGMKVALFDVSDVANPKVQSEIKIGDRGTDSELLNDHKALLFDKEKQLLAFPVNETKVDGPIVDANGYPNYGSMVFSGAYVYNLNLTDGFTLKGKITHVSSEEYMKSGYYEINYDKQIRRMLYIGDVLYGASNSMLSAYKLSNLEDLGSVSGN